MKEKILRILFCIFILAGTLLEGSLKEKEKNEILISTLIKEVHETGNVIATVAEVITKAENVAVEESPEVKNSFGMPLMEGTELLVTVEIRRSNYEYISA